jgi:hypothetical protein
VHRYAVFILHKKRRFAAYYAELAARIRPPPESLPAGAAFFKIEAIYAAECDGVFSQTNVHALIVAFWRKRSSGKFMRIVPGGRMIPQNI